MQPAVQHNTVLQHASDLFALLAYFRQADNRAQLDCAQLQTRIYQLMTEFEAVLKSDNVNHETINLAKYALTALIDETIMLSNWHEKLTWMSQTLQWHYFGEHAAGEGFFKRLSELRQQGIDNVYLIELYYVCMQLGFKGSYRLQGVEALQQLQAELKTLLQRYLGRDFIFANKAEQSEDKVVTEKNKKIFLMTGLGIFALLVVIYSSLSIAIHTSSSHINTELSHYQTSLQSLTQQQYYAGEA